MGIVLLFLKVFGLLILMFLGVMVFFVYPVNILYTNEKFTSRGDARVLFIWGIIFVALIDCLLYFFYHYGTSYLCTVSRYITCSSSVNVVAVYMLMLIHIIVNFGFAYLYMNYLFTFIKTKMLDSMLFMYAFIVVLMIIINREIYGVLFSNINIIYYFVRGLLYLVVFSPLYTFLVLALLSKIDFKKKKKVKKKVEEKKD